MGKSLESIYPAIAVGQGCVVLNQKVSYEAIVWKKHHIPTHDACFNSLTLQKTERTQITFKIKHHSERYVTQYSRFDWSINIPIP